MSYMETYKEWCTNPYFDENTKAELAAIKDNAAGSRIVFTVSWSLEPADCAA